MIENISCSRLFHAPATAINGVASGLSILRVLKHKATLGYIAPLSLAEPQKGPHRSTRQLKEDGAFFRPFSPVRITKDGKPIAMMMPAAEFEAIWAQVAPKLDTNQKTIPVTHAELANLRSRRAEAIAAGQMAVAQRLTPYIHRMDGLLNGWGVYQANEVLEKDDDFYFEDCA